MVPAAIRCCSARQSTTPVAGPNTLNYKRYTSATRTTVWGDGSGSTGTISFSTLLEVIGLRRYTVYGRIPASQNVAAGAYADSVVVTVEY